MAEKEENAIDQVVEEPKLDDKVEKLKIKKKPKKFVDNTDEVIKLDLNFYEFFSKKL